MVNRRRFLSSVSIGALGTLSLSRGIGASTQKGESMLERIGVQLYTVRSEMEKDVPGTLAKVASIGFKEVEFAGYFGQTPQQIKALLDQNKLAAPSAHVSLKNIREEWSKSIEAAQAIGHKYLVCSFIPPEERKTLDNYKKVAETFNRAGEAAKKAAIQFGFHNHDFEFMPIDGKIPYDLLLAETDPRLVVMELDLYWIVKAKQQPETYFQKFPGRFALAHVKDMDNTPKQFFTEVGRGTIDFKKILPQAKKAGIKHFFVEQDQTPGSPFDSIKISFDNLKKM